MFPTTKCVDCDHFTTNHRCLQEVAEDNNGMLHDGVFVCGKAICSICSSSYGNEGVTRCGEHSGGARKLPSQLPSEPSNRKSLKVGPKMEKELGKKPATTEKKERRPEFCSTEILLLCKAWISASEDAVVGVNQKLKTFWSKVEDAYNVFKQQHDSYMEKEQQKDNLRMQQLHRVLGADTIMLLGENNAAGAAVVKLPNRTANSLQQKWDKHVKRVIPKFIGVTSRYPKKSGEDDDEYYARIHLIYLKENPSEKSFDVYRPSYEYLRTKPKFSMACSTLPEKRKEVISLDDDDDKENNDRIRPLGRNKTKRKMEDDKVLAAVTEKLQQASSGTAQMAFEMQQCFKEVSTSIQQICHRWEVQQCIQHCSADIQQAYYNTVVKNYLSELGSKNNNPSTPSIASSTIVANEGDGISDVTDYPVE